MVYIYVCYLCIQPFAFSTFRHIVFAPSKHNAYAGSSFPGLVDAMFEIEKASDAAKRWIVVKKQLSLVVFTIQSATTSLADTINF